MRLASLLLLLALVVPLLVAQKAPPVDDRIYDEVRRKLAGDADVRGAGFEVSVKNGVVTLKGRVRTEKGRRKATSLSKKVKGVVDVDNQLKLFSES